MQPICSRSAADLQPILEHLRDVVTGPEHLDFLLAWLAQQVQDPAHHTWRSRPSCRFRSTARARLPTSRERDWCMQEPNAKEPNAKEPNAKEPNAKEPNAKELNAKELVALRPVVAPSSDSSTSAWCCVVLRGA